MMAHLSKLEVMLWEGKCYLGENLPSSAMRKIVLLFLAV